MKRIMILFTVGILLIAGCTPSAPSVAATMTLTPSFTPKPSRTYSPSRTPAPSLTPEPSLTASMTTTAVPPLTVHKWRPASVLVKLESGGGDGCCLYSYPPHLVLYANGRIIIERDYEEDQEWRKKLMTKVFSRAESCSVLNTIDQTGFLDYDTHTYRPQNSEFFSIDGAGSTAITVNAWRSNSGKFFALDSYLDLSSPATMSEETILEDPGAPIIPPALRDTYYFLESWALPDAVVYLPERLGLIVNRYESVPVQPDSPVLDWPFDELSLAEIEKLTSRDGYPSQFYVVEGGTARSVYEYFNNSFGFYGENVRQNGQVYVVFLRPILPYEIPQPEDIYNILPDPAVKPPQFELECYPSDGVMPIPIPSNP